MTILFQDVTDVRTREDDLRRELARQEQMAKVAGVGSWTVDLVTNDLTWSDQVFRIHGLEPGAMPSVAEAVAFYPPEAATLVEERLGKLIRGEDVYDCELPLITAKGECAWVHAVGELEKAPDGTPLKLFGTFRDITAQRESEARLRASEERYMFALDGAKDGIWDWDLETDSVHFSARWKAQLGYEDHEIENDFAEWASRVPDKDRESATAELQRCLSGEIPAYRAEFRMRHKDGSDRWILARAKVVARADDGSPLRIVGTHTDVTEQINLQKDLVAAKEAAEVAASVKSDFLATMSHEIRTPMNGILGLTQILLSTHTDEEQASHLKVIYESGSSLLQILNDILDLSKSESKQLVVEDEPFSPRQCVEDTLALFRQSAAKKPNLALKLHVADDVPEYILGDGGRLRQVVTNLVGNAIKFTVEGSVRVSIGTLAAAGGQRDLRIAVRDTGVGINAEGAERLFEAFTQADSTTTRRFGGTGLGLSISRNLTHLMGGTIGCRPAQPNGSIFWIEIPIKEIACQGLGSPPRVRPMATPPTLLEGDATPAERARIPNAVPAGRDSLDGMSVLVVEDNAVNQLVARKMLSKMGCTVTIADNGAEAVKAVATTRFDAVLMDCQMPVMDGFEATRAIRTHEQEIASATPIPIIAMTANAMEGDRKKCLDAGMNDYIAKPVLIGELKATLARTASAERAA